MPSTYNEVVEVSLIASVFQKPENYDLVEDLVQSKFFAWSPFRWVWDAFASAKASDESIDVITISNQLEKVGLLDSFSIFSLSKNESPDGDENEEGEYNGEKLSGQKALEYFETVKVNPDNCESYAHALIEMESLRQYTTLSDRVKAMVSKGKKSEEIENLVNGELNKISAISGFHTHTISTAKEAVLESVQFTEAAQKGESIFVETGLDFIDDILGGFGKERVYMFAGGTGDGKTALWSTVVNAVSVKPEKENLPIRMGGWFSLEMPKRECVNRIISNHTGIPQKRLDKGQIKNEEKPSYAKAAKLIGDSPILIDDSPRLSFPSLRAKIRYMQQEGCEYIGIDQLNLMEFPNYMLSAKKHEKFNWASYELKVLSREFKIPIIILHQISRGLNTGNNRGKDVEPIAQDVEEGGDKGVDAIIIIRRKKPSQLAWMYYVKNRQGETDRRAAKFIGERQRFEDMTEEIPEEFMDNEMDDVQSELYEEGFVFGTN